MRPAGTAKVDAHGGRYWFKATESRRWPRHQGYRLARVGGPRELDEPVLLGLADGGDVLGEPAQPGRLVAQHVEGFPIDGATPSAMPSR